MVPALKILPRKCLLVSAVASFVLGLPNPVEAHVKWFSQFDWDAKPLTVPELTTVTFWVMLALSLAVLVLFVLADRRMERSSSLQILGTWFEKQRPASLLVMRVAAFSTILVAWQQGTLLTPELRVENLWVERFQFVLLLLLLWPQMTTTAGLGLLALWAYGTYQFGVFHMLDYLNALGFAYFLVVRPSENRWLRASALPVLYSTVGFSLMWLGSEKLVFPQWGLYILEQNPILTLGLPSEFFLTSAAFVEIGLGFMLIICLFSRPLSITITLVFFLTTCVFGKIEIIGHTLIHASLIVFLFEGPGHTFTPPAMFHTRLPMRIAFATVNFTIAVFAMLFVYSAAASQVTVPQGPHQHPKYELSQETPKPSVELKVHKDSKSGWNVEIITEQFRFTPEVVGTSLVEGEGHAHLYLDGQKIARVYGAWYHLPELAAGEHSLRVTLNSNDHQDFADNGEVIEATTTIPRRSEEDKPNE